jgi:hypothetical protein
MTNMNDGADMLVNSFDSDRQALVFIAVLCQKVEERFKIDRSTDELKSAVKSLNDRSIEINLTLRVMMNVVALAHVGAEFETAWLKKHPEIHERENLPNKN